MTHTETAREYRKNMNAANAYVPDVVAYGLPDVFPVWDGGGTAYVIGDRARYDGQLYKCLQSHASQPGWSPKAAASLWAAVANPADEWPLIPNPIPAANPYMTGQKGSTADGRRWISLIDNNVWQPGDYPQGWTAA